MKAIRSQNHQIGSYEMKKISCLLVSVIFFKTERHIMLTVSTKSEKMWCHDAAVAMVVML